MGRLAVCAWLSGLRSRVGLERHLLDLDARRLPSGARGPSCGLWRRWRRKAPVAFDAAAIRRQGAFVHWAHSRPVHLVSHEV